MTWKTCTLLLASALLLGAAPTQTDGSDEHESVVDFEGFLGISQEAWSYRAGRQVSEAEFLRMAAEPNTIILDTRSAENYAALHVAGARHLNFSDITAENLAEVIPSHETRILIYCNNNFGNEPAWFPHKSAVAALNIPTFITLYSYGYRNLFELGAFVDPAESKLRFEGTSL